MKLSNIHTVLFDLDGVITSEYLYWDAAALTVCELLCAEYGKSFDPQKWMCDFKQIRKTVFCEDRTIKAVKDLGVNTNWDLAYLVFCAAAAKCDECGGTDVFDGVPEYLNSFDCLAPEIYERAGREYALKKGKDFESVRRGSSELWNRLFECFQHWFLGSRRYFETYGKEPVGAQPRQGLNSMEEPVVPLDKLHTALSELKESGLTLGIGTGRPAGEIELPMKNWDIAKYFDSDHCVTYTDVAAAEAELRDEQSIAKPHPFVFVKGMLGRGYSNRMITDGTYNKAEVRYTLVVGDAPSDLLAAQRAGMPFAAVLTGAGTRGYFEENHADLILNDVTELPEYILRGE